MSGPLLQEKALQLYKILYPVRDVESFKASSSECMNFLTDMDYF